MKVQYENFMEYLFAKASGSGTPLAGTFELTSRCNLDCCMCYIHRRENDAEAAANEMSTEWWLSLARKAQSMGMLTLLITGGEPLLRADFEEIYRECHKLGLLLQVNTNGTLINEEKVQFFKQYPPQRLNITLYGASRDTYAKLCGKGEAYDRVMNAIERLTQEGVPVKLNFTDTAYNCCDAEKIMAFAKEKDLPIQTVTYAFPPVRACEKGCYEAVRMSAEDAAKEHIKLQKLRYGEEGFRKRVEAFAQGNPIPPENDECQELPTDKIRCRAGDTTFWITWNGDMRPCGMMLSPSVKAEPFPEAWSAIRASREEILMPPKCMKCDLKPLCDVCAAVCFAETGQFDKVPGYACEKARAFWSLSKENIG